MAVMDRVNAYQSGAGSRADQTTPPPLPLLPPSFLPQLLSLPSPLPRCAVPSGPCARVPGGSRPGARDPDGRGTRMGAGPGWARGPGPEQARAYFIYTGLHDQSALKTKWPSKASHFSRSRSHCHSLSGIVESLYTPL